MKTIALLVGVFSLAAVTSTLNAATPLGSNLLTNGDAEQGGPSPSDGNTTATPPGWSTTGQFTTVQYDTAGGFPTSSDPGPSSRGFNFFAGGQNSAFSSASQIIDISDLAPLIDANAVDFDLSAWLGGWESQNDNAVVRLSFLSSAGSPVTIGPVSNTDRGDQTGLLFQELTGDVPTGTRELQIDIEMTRTAGSYDDGYADNVSVILRSTAVPSVPDGGSTALLLLLGAFGLRQLQVRTRK